VPKRMLFVAALALVVTAIGSGSAIAKPRATGKTIVVSTQLSFTLTASQVTSGEDITGTATLRSPVPKKKSAPVVGATLTVSVDGVVVGTVTTGSDGTAAVSYTTSTEGDHVIKVAYAGDATHRSAQRAQGFEVLPVAV
jgi:hypothetical protein